MFGELLRGVATVPAGNLTVKMSKENCKREQGKQKKNSEKQRKELGKAGASIQYTWTAKEQGWERLAQQK